MSSAGPAGPAGPGGLTATSNSSARRSTYFNSNNPERPRHHHGADIELRNPYQRSARQNATDLQPTDQPQSPQREEHQRTSHCRCRIHCVCRDDAESVKARSEHTVIQRRDLGLLDVAALIINKQIGTGIFTTPGLVLSLTGSKWISTILWFCGGLWAFLSVMIYVEFGAAFPFNGGELIYFDEVFKKPDLLSTILFSAFFLFIPNTIGNSIQFAKHILLTANPEVTDTTQLDGRLITYVAISVLTVVCFIHYFSRNSGLFLNLVFVLYKIILVVIIIICGGIASAQPGNGRSDWGNQNIDRKNVLAALVYIVYSYLGWENANYVGGELRVDRQHLKWGALLAVSITTTLYTLVTVVYSLACPFDELVGQDLGVVSYFAPKAFGSAGAQRLKVCIALSALGNLVAVIYTSSKVKQQIARQCIIPFYKFFARDDEQFGTPMGALILHWVVAVLWISVTPNTSEGYGFTIGIFTYGQILVGVFVGLAFFWIRETYEADPGRGKGLNSKPTWYPVILKYRYLQIPCALIFIGVNLMILIQSPRSVESPPPWTWPTVLFGLLIIAAVYWFVLWNIARKSGGPNPRSLEIRIVREGWMDVQERDNPALLQARVEGNSRVVIYETNGKLKRLLGSIEVNIYRLVKLIAR